MCLTNTSPQVLLQQAVPFIAHPRAGEGNGVQDFIPLEQLKCKKKKKIEFIYRLEFAVRGAEPCQSFLVLGE